MTWQLGEWDFSWHFQIEAKSKQTTAAPWDSKFCNMWGGSWMPLASLFEKHHFGGCASYVSKHGALLAVFGTWWHVKTGTNGGPSLEVHEISNLVLQSLDWIIELVWMTPHMLSTFGNSLKCSWYSQTFRDILRWWHTKKGANGTLSHVIPENLKIKLCRLDHFIEKFELTPHLFELTAGEVGLFVTFQCLGKNWRNHWDSKISQQVSYQLKVLGILVDKEPFLQQHEWCFKAGCSSSRFAHQHDLPKTAQIRLCFLENSENRKTSMSSLDRLIELVWMTPHLLRFFGNSCSGRR